MAAASTSEVTLSTHPRVLVASRAQKRSLRGPEGPSTASMPARRSASFPRWRRDWSATSVGCLRRLGAGGAMP